MANWYDPMRFVLFKETNEVKQISHVDNSVVWFTDNTFLYPYEFNTVKPITLSQIAKSLNVLSNIKKELKKSRHHV